METFCAGKTNTFRNIYISSRYRSLPNYIFINHFLRGGLYENLVINEFIKESLNKGEEPNLTFWRDSTGNEVDLLRTEGGMQYAYEIKSSTTYSSEFFKGISKWAKLSDANPEQCFAIYKVDKKLTTSEGKVINWQ